MTAINPGYTVAAFARHGQIPARPAPEQQPRAQAAATPATPEPQAAPAAANTDTQAALLTLQETDAAPETVQLRLPGETITARRIDAVLKPMRIAELPEEDYQGAVDALESMLRGKYMQSELMIEPDPSYLANHPAMKTYATVVVGGKVVATLDNQGMMTTDNALGAQLRGLPDQVNGRGGPDLAQARAEHVAALLGGKVVKAKTAISQAQFNANPIDQERLRPKIDVDAMRLDPMNAQIQALKAERAAYLARQAA